MMDLGGASRITIFSFPTDSDEDPYGINFGTVTVEIIDGKVEYDIGNFYIDDEIDQ